jgi:hypothetical protein
MNYEDWEKIQVVGYVGELGWKLAANAWRAAFRAGQEDMRERAAKKVESFIGWASDHNLECRGDDIRALEIKGE